MKLIKCEHLGDNLELVGWRKKGVMLLPVFICLSCNGTLPLFNVNYLPSNGDFIRLNPREYTLFGTE